MTNAARSAVRRATECLNDVDRAVRALIEHVRGTDLGRDDRAFRTRPLCEKLSKLKMAGALGGSLPDTAAQLMARYEHATRELSQALSTKLEEVDSKARSEHIESYGLKVFSYVQGELRHGLADHVALRVDVDTVLTELRGMADETAGRMQMDRFTIPYVDSTVKPALDKLKRGTGGWFAWWSRRQYEEEKQSFNAGLLGLLDATQRPRSRRTSTILRGSVFCSCSISSRRSGSISRRVSGVSGMSSSKASLAPSAIFARVLMARLRKAMLRASSCSCVSSTSLRRA